MSNVVVVVCRLSAILRRTGRMLMQNQLFVLCGSNNKRECVGPEMTIVSERTTLGEENIQGPRISGMWAPFPRRRR